MDYRVQLAKRMLSNKKGSLIGAVLAVSIGILVIHGNFVIFQGLYDAIVRDLSSYRFGDVLGTDEESFITKSDVFLVNWFERLPYVEAATPRVQSSAAINVTKNGKLIEEFRVPVIGVDPFRDPRVSTAHETVTDGQYVFSRNSVVVGSRVVSDLGNIKVDDSLQIKITDRRGDDQIRRFIVTGIVTSPGGQGLDSEVIMHIDALRDMLDRDGETGEILVKLKGHSSNYLNRGFVGVFPLARVSGDAKIDRNQVSGNLTATLFYDQSGISILSKARMEEQAGGPNYL